MAATDGGAVAHGHPPDATGAVLLGWFAAPFGDCGGRYGRCTRCIGLGRGVATLVGRV